jgi:hypothetical protein
MRKKEEEPTRNASLFSFDPGECRRVVRQAVKDEDEDEPTGGLGARSRRRQKRERIVLKFRGMNREDLGPDY